MQFWAKNHFLYIIFFLPRITIWCKQMQFCCIIKVGRLKNFQEIYNSHLDSTHSHTYFPFSHFYSPLSDKYSLFCLCFIPRFPISAFTDSLLNKDIFLNFDFNILQGRIIDRDVASDIINIFAKNPQKWQI